MDFNNFWLGELFYNVLINKFADFEQLRCSHLFLDDMIILNTKIQILDIKVVGRNRS